VLGLERTALLYILCNLSISFAYHTCEHSYIFRVLYVRLGSLCLLIFITLTRDHVSLSLDSLHNQACLCTCSPGSECVSGSRVPYGTVERVKLYSCKNASPELTHQSFADHPWEWCRLKTIKHVKTEFGTTMHLRIGH
jgi:hypothetical protein